MIGVNFPPLRISVRRYARLLRLLASGKLQLSSVTDYSNVCDDGVKTAKSVKSFVLCVTDLDADDDLVVDDEGDSSSSTVSDAGSVSTAVATTSPALSSGNNTGSATLSPTTTTTFVSSASSADSRQLLMTLAVSTIACFMPFDSC